MKSNVLATAILIVLVTAGAFLLVHNDDSAGAQITIFDDLISDEFTYVYDDSDSLDLDGDPSTKEVTLISYNFNADKVTIPDTILYGGETYLVTAIAGLNTPTGQSVFYQKNNMTSLVMGSNVRAIGDSAFRECVNLAKLDLKNVTDVGAYSFFHCTSATEIKADKLLTVGNYAFAVSDVFGGSAYTGPIPYVAELSLPNVTAIGVGAFGAVNNQSLARDFGKVSLPECVSIGQYAFAKAKIDVSLSIPNVKTIGNYAFYLIDQSNRDDTPGYSLSVPFVESIGTYAFSGRAVGSITLSPAEYTIGSYAFYCTDLDFADLGMVTSIGTGAFDGIDRLQYFVVSPANGKYASLISKEKGAKGVNGALYELDASRDPKTLIKLPPKINTQLGDLNNKFTVADGVKTMANTAFNGCPAIEVDLNEIKAIPINAFTKTQVTGVNAANASDIGVGAFYGCGSLTYFNFLDTGGHLTIGDTAFENTGLTAVYLPKKTTVGAEAFSNLRTSTLDDLVIGVWGDTIIEPDSFLGTTMYALQVSSDPSEPASVTGAKTIFDGWNAAGWTHGGSESTGMLIIDNTGSVDISGLVPDGQGYIVVKNFNHAAGALQFVESKEKKSPPFHMASIKPGVYGPESHGTAGGPVDVKTDISGGTSSGEMCYAGDGRTWELVFEYYTINFYSFLTESDGDGDGIPDGKDPDYDNPLILSSNAVGDRDYYGSSTYLAGRQLKSLLWPDFVRCSLQGWYTADDPDHALASIVKDTRITAIDVFGSTIPEELIYRDPVTDRGMLNLYAMFIGKEYTIELESRVTGGHHPATVPADTVADPSGGSVELALDTPYNGSSGFATAENGGDKPGCGRASYPYGTELTLYAKPKAGYAFVGWAVVNNNDEENPSMLFPAVKSDRSFVTADPALRIAAWELTLYSSLKFVAYFAKTVTVTFDANDGTPQHTVMLVVGDYLVETGNDYNSFDYDFLAEFSSTESINTGPGSSYYPGTPSQTGLAFGGWCEGSPEKCYAEFDETDAMGDGSYLKSFAPMPNLPYLTLKAKWYAEIVFYANNGINGAAAMAGSGLAETSAGSGVFAYRHDVGAYDGAAGGYTAALPYFIPAVPDVNFNGWYVLKAGGTSVGDIEAVAGANIASHYPDLYPTEQRFEPGAAVQEDTSLMALYSADVCFYFNGATTENTVDPSISAGTPYTVAVPVSLSAPVSFGDAAYFGTIGSEMLNAETTGGIHKEDEMGERMYFIGWYGSADGASLPTAADTEYTGAIDITQNVKLIAGWGFMVAFDNGGAVGAITDQATSAEWLPENYHFFVLEGTVFRMDGDGMPVVTLGGIIPTTWFDDGPSPYRWFMDDPAVYYTYSVVLTPEFRDLFQFNLMGGNPGVVQVPYSTTDTFAAVLDRLNESLFNGTAYVELTKPGLRYEDNGTAGGAGDKPNAVWYKNGGGVPDYVGGGAFAPWEPTFTVGSDTRAYIRWLADVAFDVNVPAGAADGGTSDDPAAMTVDEGTPFTSLGTPAGTLSVPVYNSNRDKTFKGWFDGGAGYTDQHGTVTSAANVASSVTLVAKWGAEVKFYYTGSLVHPLPADAVAGSDSTGLYVIVDVASNNTVIAPNLSKTGFTDNHLMWYSDGFDGDAPICISSFVHSAVPESFDLGGPIYTNTTVYGRWYATVDFHVSASASSVFFDASKSLLEGVRLSDLFSEMGEDPNPYAGDPQRADWEFIGWYDKAGADPTDYEDLGEQYYATGFDYLQNGSGPDNSGSSKVKGNVTLNYEFVVLVDFDCGFTPGVEIGSQYLRVNQPLPDGGSARFTPMPARAGVTFTGWFDFLNLPVKRYTQANSDEPDPAMLVTESMTLKAAWLVTVRFYDLQGYLANGLVLNTDGVKIAQVGDCFEMPESTTLREFILSDPSPGGKTFVSWFAEQGTADGAYEAGDTMYGLNSVFVGDITLTAGYGYLTHFDTNGGTPSVIPDALVIEGQSIALPERPAKGRLTFLGWSDGSAVKDAGAAVTPAGEAWYTAKWLVVIKMYDGISMKPVASIEWNEDDGLSSLSFSYEIATSPEYDGRVVQIKMSWADTSSGFCEAALEKFVDKYDASTNSWVSLYSVFNGWLDPFTGMQTSPTDNLSELLSNASDSAALFATWQERARFYDASGPIGSPLYIDSGDFLSAAAPPGAAGGADLYNQAVPLNLDTYRIRDSGDFLSIGFVTVTFDGNGGTPQTQVFSGVVSGTMLCALGFSEPVRNGMYFAGWYSGNTRLSFTDRLYKDTALTAKWSPVPVEHCSIFAFAGANASITPSGMFKVMPGDTVTFDFRADAEYRLSLLIDGREIDSNGMSSYTFSNVTGDHSIEVRADIRDPRSITGYLTIDTEGTGDVLYSTDGGASFRNYASPLPMYSDLTYVLNAVPGKASYFGYWSGGASGTGERVSIAPSEDSNVAVTAHFGDLYVLGSGRGPEGSLAIMNLICMVLCIMTSIIALTVAYKRNYEGTGTGKGLRLGAVLVAVISLVVFLLTQGFGGSYVVFDAWSPVMFMLLGVTLALVLVSIRYDFRD